MVSPALPSVGNLVELWFSGYDEYYTGTVDSVSPPDTFSVVLDDGTAWPVDRINNIWRYAAPATAPAPAPAPASASAPVSAPEDKPAPEPAPPKPPLDDDDDDDRPPLAQPAPVPPTAAPVPVPTPLAPAPAPAQTALAKQQPLRRKSGRAFRKSTGGPPTTAQRPVEADPVSVAAPAQPERRRPVDDAEPRPTRPTRGRRVVADDDSSVPVTPVRPVRRGRPPLVGQKRAVDALDDAWEDTAAEKRRRRGDGDGLANGVPMQVAVATPAMAAERVTRSGARKEDDAVEKLSTKAVTAIAVEAALASAKAVLKPLNDQLVSLRGELENISATAKRAAEDLTFEGRRKKRGDKTIDGAVSAAALEALQLDLSELVGGGEARIRAYAHLSDKEFEGFHKTIDEQSKALKELDRLLLAAQELGKKAEKNSARDARASRKTRRG